MSGWRKRQVSNQIMLDEIYEVIRSNQHGMEGFLYTYTVEQIIQDLKHHFGDSMDSKTIEGTTQVTLSRSTLDEIIISQLVEHREMLCGELAREEEGGWMHPDDVINHKKLVKSMSRIIEYYGGE